MLITTSSVALFDRFQSKIVLHDDFPLRVRRWVTLIRITVLKTVCMKKEAMFQYYFL